MKSISYMIVFLVAFYLSAPNRDAIAQPRPADDQSAIATECIQIALILCGYDPGPVDGILGTKTMKAIAAFLGERPSAEIAKVELFARADEVHNLRSPSYPNANGKKNENFHSTLSRLGTRWTGNLYRNLGSPESRYQASGPIRAENGDIRGFDNDGDGRREPVYVNGYYRKDGTYVRGHYRARPRR